MESGLHRPDGRLHDFGQLDEGQIEKVVKQDGRLLGLRKGGDGTVDRFGLFLAKEDVLDALRGVLKVVDLFHRLNNRAPALSKAKQTVLTGDREEPSPESLVIAEGGDVTDRPRESLLHDVERVLLVLDQAAREAEETKLVGREERVPGAPVAQSRPADPLSLVLVHLHCLKNAATRPQVQTSPGLMTSGRLFH